MVTTLSLLLLALVPVKGDGDVRSSRSFTVLSPPNQSVVRGAGLAHLILELPEPVAISARLNGKPLNAPRVSDRIHHYSLRLIFGLNTIVVEARNGTELIEQEERQIFFFDPIAKEKKIPRGFTPKAFHQVGDGGKKCLSCHVLEPRKADFSPLKPQDSTCHDCHKGLTQFRQVHGPAALWNCTQCHDASSQPAMYSTPLPVRDLCFQCHTNLKTYYFGSKYQHGPTATGMCTICHNPHATDNEYWLKKEPWDLCTTCHLEKASGRHVIAWGPSGNTHPTRGRPDPTKPEREFSCRSCHNPHASNAPKLWNFGATTYYQLCWTCHRK